VIYDESLWRDPYFRHRRLPSYSLKENPRLNGQLGIVASIAAGWGRASTDLRFTSLTLPIVIPVMPKAQSSTLRQPASRLTF
jgi:hypothetical protein